MQRVGEAFRRAGVACVCLAHGTFVGTDATGALREIERVFPAAGQAMGRRVKQLVDALVGEKSNYTAEFAQCFESALAQPGESPIPVRLFHWSSENHHIGRADGAVRLIDKLASLGIPPGRRVLLWGHSHAGNVFALTSCLLGGDKPAVEQFFHAARTYYRRPLWGRIDLPVWDRVRRTLGGSLDPAALDMVTFGTPIRYGWNRGGCGRLLHFVHHRPAPGLPEHLAPFPPKLANVLTAAHGDFVQQFGIAGTNLSPGWFAWRSWLADKRLGRVLQDPGGGPAGLLQRLRVGAIVPDAGTTLLVDYGLSDADLARQQLGHAVYTGKKWILFHAEEVARRLYGAV